MSDNLILDVALSMGNDASRWQQMAKQMEAQRNEAYAALAASEAARAALVAEVGVLRSAFEHLERDHGCTAYPRVAVTLRAAQPAAAAPVAGEGE